MLLWGPTVVPNKTPPEERLKNPEIGQATQQRWTGWTDHNIQVLGRLWSLAEAMAEQIQIKLQQGNFAKFS